MEELSALNPLTKLRRLHLEGPPDDPRLHRLSLGHDVVVMTSCSGSTSTHIPAIMPTKLEHFISIPCLQPAPRA
jgi:hypothetical protein